MEWPASAPIFNALCNFGDAGKSLCMVGEVQGPVVKTSLEQGKEVPLESWTPCRQLSESFCSDDTVQS
jgi:hypothetical protein